MNVLVGVDTLTYHGRLEAGEISLEAMMNEIAELGFSFVQLNAHHLRDRAAAEVEQLRKLASDLQLELTLAGSMVGRAREGDSVEAGAERVGEWLELAERLGSPYARVSSGFYRNELLGDPAAIRAEQAYVIDVLARATERRGGDTKVIVENHSDFTPDEYIEIIESVGPDRIGVFLDLINPVSLLLDPLPTIERLAPWAVAGHVKDYRLASRYIEDGFFRRGFEVQWCYPGEGVADLRSLVGALALAPSESPYLLSIEGLDNRAGVADQRERLAASLTLLRTLVDQAPARPAR